MSKNFDDLFNDFFKRNKKKKDEVDKSDDISESSKKMLDILKSISNIDITEDIENQIDKDLGKPDIIEHYMDNGMWYEKRIWKTENGELVKLIITDNPDLINKEPIKETPLKEQLEEAVKAENFEEATRLRDLINPKKKRIRKSK